MKAQRNFMIEETMCEATEKLWLHLLQRWWWQCDYWTVGGLTELFSALLNLSSAGRSWSSPVETKTAISKRMKADYSWMFWFLSCGACLILLRESKRLRSGWHASCHLSRVSSESHCPLLPLSVPLSRFDRAGLLEPHCCTWRHKQHRGHQTNLGTWVYGDMFLDGWILAWAWSQEGGLGRGGEGGPSGAASCFYSVRCDETFWSDGGATVVNRPLLAWFS